MAFFLKGSFPRIEPTLHTRAASVHLETSFALGKKKTMFIYLSFGLAYQG